MKQAILISCRLFSIARYKQSIYYRRCALFSHQCQATTVERGVDVDVGVDVVPSHLPHVPSMFICFSSTDTVASDASLLLCAVMRCRSLS